MQQIDIYNLKRPLFNRRDHWEKEKITDAHLGHFTLQANIVESEQ